MATAGTVTIRLDGDSATLIRELNKANRAANRTFRDMRRDALQLAKGMAVIAGAAATAFGLMVRHSLEAADALAKNADRLGVTTEALGTLQVAADLANVSQETLVKALQKQQVALGTAARGSGETARAFTKLGLSVQELISIPADQQFARINEALNQFGNVTERNALRAQIYGARLSEVGNLANLTSEDLAQLDQYLRDVGYTMSRIDTAQIEQANDAIKLARIAMEGLSNRVTVALAPLIEGVAKELASSFARAGESSDGFRLVAQKAMIAVGATAGFVGDAILGIGAVFKTAAGAGLVAFGTLQGAMAGVGKAVEVVFINPILAAVEVLLQIASALPGQLGKSAGEWEKIVQGARTASFATEGWNDALNEIGAGLDLIQTHWTEVTNRELPSQAIDKWVQRAIKASEEAAARMGQAIAEGQKKSAEGGTGGVAIKLDTASLLAQANNAAQALENLERSTSDEIRRIVITGEQGLTAELGRLIETRAKLLTDAEERAAAAGGSSETFEREKELAKNRTAVAKEAMTNLLKMRQTVVNAGWFIDLKVATDTGAIDGLQKELEATRQRIQSVEKERLTIVAAMADPAALQRDIDALKAELASVQPLTIAINTGALKAADRDIAALSSQLDVLTERKFEISASIPGLAGIDANLAQVRGEIEQLQALRLKLRLDTSEPVAAAAALEAQLKTLGTEADRLQAEQVALRVSVPGLAEVEGELARARELAAALAAERIELEATGATERISALDAELVQANAHVAALQGKRVALTADAGPLRAIEERLNAVQTTLGALRTSKVTLETAGAAAAAGDLEASLTMLQTQLETLERRRIEITTAIPGLPAVDADIAKLKAKLEDITARKVELDTSGATAASAVLQKEITDLSAELGRLQDRRITLTADSTALVALDEKTAAVRRDIEAVMTAQVALTGADQAELQLKALQKQIEDLQSRRLSIIADSTELTGIEQRLTGLRAELSQALTAHVELTGAAQAGQKVEELRAQIATLESRQLSVSVVTYGIESADRQIADLEQQLKAVQGLRLTLPADSAELAAATAEAARLQAELDAVSGRKIRITTAVEGLQQLEPQLKQLRDELDALRIRRLELTADSTAYLEAGERMQALQAKVAALEGRRVHLIADLDSSAAQRELTALDNELTELQARLAHPPQVAGFALDFSAAVAALEQNSARQIELAQQTTEEIRRITISGQQQISQELIDNIEARAQQVVAAEQKQAAARAALGDSKAQLQIDEALGEARIKLWNEVADQWIATRQKMAEGGAVALPTVDPAAIQAQTQQATEQYLAAWQLANEQRLAGEQGVLQTLFLADQQAGAALIALAAEQAKEKVLAEFIARGEALDETGQAPDDPAAKIAFQQQIQQETLALESDFLNQRLALLEQFGSQYVGIQRAIAAIAGKDWAKQHKGAITAYASFANSVATIGRALFGENKALAIATTIINTYRGAMAAFAETPGPIWVKGAAAAAAIALGAQNLAAIRSSSPTGGGGIGSFGGGSAVAVGSTPEFGGDVRDRDTRQVVQVIIQGDVLGWDDFVQSRVIESLRDALDGRDVVIFHGGSRQAQEIRDGD